MSKTKVSKAIFLDFLKSLALKGQIESKEVLLTVDKKSVSGKLVSADRSLAVAVSMETDEFDDIGDVGIDNLQQLIQIVSSMGNEFDVTFSSNKLVVSNKKSKLTNVLRNPEFIVNKLDNEKFKSVLQTTEKGISFVLPKEVLKDIVSKFKLIDSEELTFSSNGKELKVKSKNTNDETELETVYDIETNDKFNVKLNKFVVDLFDSMNNEITVSLAKENPACLAINYKSDTTKATYIIALLVQEEEIEENKKVTLKKK